MGHSKVAWVSQSVAMDGPIGQSKSQTYLGIYEELDVLICFSTMRPKAWRRHGSAFPHLSQPSAAYIINIY